MAVQTCPPSLFLTCPSAKPVTTSALHVRRLSKGAGSQPRKESPQRVWAGQRQSLVSFLPRRVGWMDFVLCKG
eukprot:912811-Pelagomonas_calceolata.AAC.2